MWQDFIWNISFRILTESGWFLVLLSKELGGGHLLLHVFFHIFCCFLCFFIVAGCWCWWWLLLGLVARVSSRGAQENPKMFPKRFVPVIYLPGNQHIPVFFGTFESMIFLFPFGGWYVCFLEGIAGKLGRFMLMLTGAPSFVWCNDVLHDLLLHHKRSDPKELRSLQKARCLVRWMKYTLDFGTHHFGYPAVSFRGCKS